MFYKAFNHKTYIFLRINPYIFCLIGISVPGMPGMFGMPGMDGRRGAPGLRGERGERGRVIGM